MTSDFFLNVGMCLVLIRENIRILVSLKGVFRRKDRGSQVHPHALSKVLILLLKIGNLRTEYHHIAYRSTYRWP